MTAEIDTATSIQINLEKMTKTELLDLANKKSVEGISSGKTKAELIKLILSQKG